MTYAIFKVNNKKGLKDPDGNIAVPAEYDDVGGDYPTWIWVKKNKKYGIILPQQKTKSDMIYDDLWFSEHVKNLIWTKKDKKWGAVDYNLKQVVPFLFRDIDLQHTGSAHVFVNFAGKKYFGVVEKNGKIISGKRDLIKGAFA